MGIPYNYKAIEKKWREYVETLSQRECATDTVLEKYREIGRMHEHRMKDALHFEQDLYWDYGSDAVRMYEVFSEPEESDAYFDDGGLDGVYRFLTRFWRLSQEKREASKESASLCSEMTEKIRIQLNKKRPAVAIAVMMEYTKKLYAVGVGTSDLLIMIRLLAPFAPYLAEELWRENGQEGSVMDAPWPNVESIRPKNMILPVQVNKKVRGHICVSADSSEEEILLEARKILKRYGNVQILKEIYIPDRIVSFFMITDESY